MSHSVVHFEIPADDPEQLAGFYRELFGWTLEKMDMGGTEYWSVMTVPVDDKMMPTEQGVNGGMMKRQMPEQVPTNYIGVESVDDYTAKAVALGATVIVPKVPVPHMGYFTIIMDPQRNPLGLWQEDPSAA